MFEEVKRVHFVGIGGIGMSGIAEVLIAYGYTVSGSDMKRSALTERLRSLGARISYRHKKENLGDAQVLVYSSAVERKNPEILQAKKRNIPVIQRGQMLSEIVRKGFSIAVSGAHGKTTTTAMIGRVIKTARINPTVIIGGIVKGLSKNAILGKGKVFVAEADESDGTFQGLRPNIAIVTNTDREHMDYYGDFRSMEDAYINFMNGVPFDGLVTVCGDDTRLRKIADRLGKRVRTFGLGRENYYSAGKIKSEGFSTSFDLKVQGRKYCRIKLKSPGVHNVLNALAACSAGFEMGLGYRHIKKSLEQFEGIERRMELKGELMGATVVDDYAHHPTEIRSTLDTARSIWDGRRVVVVFQPHRYTRLKDLFRLFPKAFRQADVVFVTDIYSAGEARKKRISASDLVRLLKKGGKEAYYMHNWKRSVSKVMGTLKKGDIVFSLGAGDVNRLYDYMKAAQGCEQRF